MPLGRVRRGKHAAVLRRRKTAGGRGPRSSGFFALVLSVERSIDDCPEPIPYNGMNGEGILNMRLTADEASEVRGFLPESQTYSDCIQSSPCEMWLALPQVCVVLCAPRTAQFLSRRLIPCPSLAQNRARIRLFDADLRSVSVLTIHGATRPVHRRGHPAGWERALCRFARRRRKRGIHFWPGRGLNSGLLSALALVRTLNRWSGSPLRDADFTSYEAVMSALQHRHKRRAWRQMAVRRNGILVPVSELIHQALSTHTARTVLITEMETRIREIVERLEGRMDERRISRDHAAD